MDRQGCEDPLKAGDAVAAAGEEEKAERCPSTRARATSAVAAISVEQDVAQGATSHRRDHRDTEQVELLAPAAGTPLMTNTATPPSSTK
jgi:hypothetical protein